MTSSILLCCVPTKIATVFSCSTPQSLSRTIISHGKGYQIINEGSRIFRSENNLQSIYFSKVYCWRIHTKHLVRSLSTWRASMGSYCALPKWKHSFSVVPQVRNVVCSFLWLLWDYSLDLLHCRQVLCWCGKAVVSWINCWNLLRIACHCSKRENEVFLVSKFDLRMLGWHMQPRSDHRAVRVIRVIFWTWYFWTWKDVIFFVHGLKCCASENWCVLRIRKTDACCASEKLMRRGPSLQNWRSEPCQSTGHLCNNSEKMELTVTLETFIEVMYWPW